MFLQKIGPISSGCGQTVAGGSWADSASCSQTISNVIAVTLVLERKVLFTGTNSSKDFFSFGRL